ncbi:MAG: hypothetical protein OEM41_10330 [Ignavibacteria bacterium]|nr:hypothetical protein [Ignavibacteria bacterium]
MADEILVNGTRTYAVGRRSTVYLTVTIGDGQVGGSSVLWKGEIIGEGVIQKLKIGGPGEKLRFKTFRCSTRVKDINPSTNRTSVTHNLSGGQKEREFLFAADVTSEGGYATYSITFVFV